MQNELPSHTDLPEIGTIELKILSPNADKLELPLAPAKFRLQTKETLKLTDGEFDGEGIS